MGKTHKTTVTFLDMKADPGRVVPPPARKLALMRAHNPPLHYYRYLYDVIGTPYVWVNRKHMSDAEVDAIIGDENVEIYVLYVGGVPAGFAELDFREMPVAELSYMGLTPEFIGQGLGEYLLHQAIEIAWGRQINRLKVQTCTMDHPRALVLYQRAGFVPYAQVETELEEVD